ncbi:MAG: TlpA disulfide reductase family protein [Planctomycetota bacterium]
MRRMSTLLAITAAAGFALAGPGHDHDHDQDHAHDHAHDHAEQLSIKDFRPDYKLPELWVGAKAPELRIAEFVKGDPVTSFEPGRVYVVEFWATWCGPCIKAFPHLSKLQKAHKDKLTVIGVNIWDEQPGENEADHSERITEFVDKQADKMAYTVAVEDGEQMAESWMKKAGRSGIPSAFLVDQDGKIAWMGHPMGMDDTLKALLDGKHDAKAAAEEAAQEHEMRAWSDVTMEHVMKGGEEADATVRKILHAKFSDEPGFLNAVAWNILTNERVSEPNYETALMAGKHACEATEWKDPGILDTYALAAFKTGDVKKAIKVQKKALGLLEGTEWDSARGEFEARLAEFEAAL